MNKVIKKCKITRSFKGVFLVAELYGGQEITVPYIPTKDEEKQLKKSPIVFLKKSMTIEC